MENVSTQKPRILIVDDVEGNRFILRDIISDMGCQPILVENGIQALKIFQKSNPQLVLLDIAMPKMDGYELCNIIKINPATKDIPIIFISAYHDAQNIVKGFEVGCEDYVTRPFVPEVVKARVGVQLKLSAAARKLAEMKRCLQASAEDEKSFYEESYMERLKYNSRILAQEMQLSEKYGKMISDSYIEGIEMAADIAQYHHENWDGSGYPAGIAGDKIPLSAQIMALVERYCRLTEQTAGREPYTVEEALAVMQEDSGRKYNSDIFFIFREISHQLK